MVIGVRTSSSRATPDFTVKPPEYAPQMKPERLELGSVHIVNDYHSSAFWNVSRDAGVVLLSFDVVRPEYEFCRAALVDSRARLTRAFRRHV
jgi:uncharacterized heparinase superfamily protein